MTQAVTSIDPRLIKMVGRKLYSSNPLPIVVRELLQNSVDACKRAGVKPRITITIRRISKGYDDNDWLVSCDDNGIGMTAEQIVTDFLCLGGKKLNGEGQTGGFGIAKAAIMGCDDWSVKSLDNYLNRDTLLANADIKKRKFRKGTKVTVRIREAVYGSAMRLALQMVYYSDVNIHLIAERSIYPSVKINDPNAGLPNVKRKLLEEGDAFDMWGVSDLHVTDERNYNELGETGWNVVRLDGLMQFLYGMRLDYRKTNLFFDIKTDKAPDDPLYPFSMSREDLDEDYKNLIAAFVVSHNANVMQSVAAVENEVPENEKIEILPGRLLNGSRSTTYDRHKRASESGMGNQTVSQAELQKKLRNLHESRQAPVRLLIRRYERNSETKSWHAKLLLAWQDILQLVAETGEEFGIGITSDRFRVACRWHMDSDVYYVLNPTLAVPDELREQSAEAIVLALWTLACHEVTHKYVDDHNEWFTTTMGSVERDSSETILQSLRTIAKRLG